MITFKQLDAFYWVVKLGSFEAAAKKLFMSQSAISKRIHEIEEAFNIQLFDRSKRNATLTVKGAEFLEYAKIMIGQRDFLVDRISSNETVVHRFRLGVTELTSLTWLPALTENIRNRYPRLVLEIFIDISTILFKKLETDQLDLIIVPDIFDDTRFVATPLKAVENCWMCSPKLYSEPNVLTLDAFSQFTILVQGSDSGTGLIYERWFNHTGVKIPKTIVSNYLVAQVGLTISGLGMSYLPRQCMRPFLQKGILRIVETTPRLPFIRYTALYRADRVLGLSVDITDIALQSCNFDKLFLYDEQ